MTNYLRKLGIGVVGVFCLIIALMACEEVSQKEDFVDGDFSESDMSESENDTAEDEDVDMDGEPDEEDLSESEVEKEILPEGTPLFGSLGPGPAMSVLPENITSCNIYKAETCLESKLHVCDIYDQSKGGFDDDPDPTLKQIYYLDRYYDLYHRMEGQHSDLRFTKRMEPGLPESEWGDPQYFHKYDGFGDAAGWTGTALQSNAARFYETGSEADYMRMLETFDTMALLYDINQAPGMLSRSFYGMLEEDAPDPVGLAGKALNDFADNPDGRYYYFRYPIAEEFLTKLPAYLKDGVSIDGQHYGVTPVHQGDSSRDMYVRSLPGIMLAYDMLKEGERENAIKEIIKREIPCTLKRMKKVRIRNLQSNETILEAINAYFSNGYLIAEEGDMDLTKTDTIVGYMMEQPHSEHMDKFDFSCPDSLPLEVLPEYDFDADDGLFLIDFLDFMNRSVKKGEVENPIAWIQLPSIRGSDTIFMTQWALAGYYLSGDEKFLEFLENMMEELDYWPVIDMMGSFWMPKWCRAHFAPSLMYPTLWNIMSRVDKNMYPEYWGKLSLAIKEELRDKEMLQTNDALFGIYYSSMVDENIDPDAAEYSQSMVGMLDNFSQYQCTTKYALSKAECRTEPLRNYAIDLLTDMPSGFDAVEVEELSQDKKDICLAGGEILGVTFEGTIEDERPRATLGMPLDFRVFGSFVWQMDPFMLHRTYGSSEAKVQWPGQGMSVAYWMARMQGQITKGKGSALAWRNSGESCK